MDSCYKYRLHILCHEVCLLGGADHGNAFVGCWSGFGPIRTFDLEALRLDADGDDSLCSGIDGLQVSIANQTKLVASLVDASRDLLFACQEQGDFMTDMEGIYESLDKFLTGGQYPVGALATLEGPYVEPQPEPQLFENVDLAEVALQHVANLNGQEVDRAVREPELDEHVNMMDGKTQEERRRRYLESDRGEVSDPDEWASIHFGDRDEYDHDRMLAFSQANQLRLQNALASLQVRRAQAENKEVGKLLRHAHERCRKSRPNVT